MLVLAKSLSEGLIPVSGVDLRCVGPTLHAYEPRARAYLAYPCTLPSDWPMQSHPLRPAQPSATALSSPLSRLMHPISTLRGGRPGLSLRSPPSSYVLSDGILFGIPLGPYRGMTPRGLLYRVGAAVLTDPHAGQERVYALRDLHPHALHLQEVGRLEARRVADAELAQLALAAR